MMTLTEAVRRCKLPIHVTFDRFYGDAAFPFAVIASDGRCWVAGNAADATRAYLAAVAACEEQHK